MESILRLFGYRKWEELSDKEKTLWKTTYSEYLNHYLSEIEKLNSQYVEEVKKINLRNLDELRNLNSRYSNINKTKAFLIAKKQADKKLKLLKEN